MSASPSIRPEPSDTPPVTLYNKNGVVVRQIRLNEELSELALEFLDADRSTAVVYCVAALYLAFCIRRPLDFVPSSRLLKRAVLFTRDFDDTAKAALVEGVAATQQYAPALFRLADEHF